MGQPVPSAGDIVWAELDPIAGTEQGGRRPALVLTPLSFNQVSKRVIVCPITSKVRGWTFEVPLPADIKTVGCVLVDQVRSINRERRIFRYIETPPVDLLERVLDRLMTLVGR